jgi:hypothetical protein
LRADAVERGCDLRGDRRRLQRIADVGAHGDRRQAIAMPDDAVLEAIFERGDLGQRHRLAAGSRHREAGEHVQVRALIARAAQHHLDQLVASR